jgi:hypothetical protein
MAHYIGPSKHFRPVAAFLVATEPIFVAIIVSVTHRSRITPSLLLGLLLGLTNNVIHPANSAASIRQSECSMC